MRRQIPGQPEVEIRAAQVDDVEPCTGRQGSEDGLVVGQDQVPIYVLGHDVAARVTRDRVEDAGRAGLNRAATEIDECFRDLTSAGPTTSGCLRSSRTTRDWDFPTR